MKQENLLSDLSTATVVLLNMAKERCMNEISDNCLYIISEIKNGKTDFQQQRKVCSIQNDLKTPRSLEKLLPKLETLFPDFYDVNLCIYKAEKKRTIVEIKYYPRTALDPDYRIIVQPNEPMLHCRLEFPLHLTNQNEKFDVNWLWLQ